MYNYTTNEERIRKTFFGCHDETDYEKINVHGYDSESCPRCGSTDICKGSTNYCNHCGNRW